MIGEAIKTNEKPSPFYALRKIVNTDGVKGLYKGLSAALFRQATYGTVRMGLYKYMYHQHELKHGSVSPLHKAKISLFTGFIGSLVGNPSDLALVRF